MNASGNILARLRRHKARGAFHAAVVLLASQLSAALTPCFASVAGNVTHIADGVEAVTPSVGDASRDARHVDHASRVDEYGQHAAQADHANHANHADHTQHADHAGHGNHADLVHHGAHTTHTGGTDDRQHCPHCDGVAPDGGVAHAGQAHACTSVEIVDTAPRVSLELAAKLFHATVMPIAVESPPQPLAHASPRRDAPRLPSAVPLNIRHCVFLI